MPNPLPAPEPKAPRRTPGAASPGVETTPRRGLVAALRRFEVYIHHVRWMWAVVFASTVVVAATEPLVPALLKPLLDKGFTGRGFSPWLVPAALLLIFGVRGAAGFVADLALAKIANSGMYALREALFARLLAARMDLFTRESASSLANTIVHEVQNAVAMLTNSVSGLAKDGLALVALVGYLLYLNWALTLVVALMAPLVGWLMRVVSARLQRLTRSSQSATIELAYTVEENVLAAREVRLHGAQGAQGERFERLNNMLRQLAMKWTVAGAAITPLSHMIAAAALSIVICVALTQSADGLTVGGFASFVTAMMMLIAPIKRLSESTGPITKSITVLERSFDLAESCPQETGGTWATARAEGRVEFRNATVTYPGASVPALDRVTIEMHSGETLALVGPSGSGKTTLANLLPRFVEPTSGSVLLDGRDIREWDLAALRRQFAMVSQNVVMFNQSLAANVALGDTFDRARVRDVLAAANLSDLVEQLPRGIDTHLGHNAAALSGGQRQRLAIARALYKDAPILILDEATSALDQESERAVQQALRRLMAGRTTLIIAHRLSTIEHADRIAVLKDGRVAELGSHGELTRLGGLYASLRALHDGEALVK
ncbi:lipid A export permease/ATP-binding protein MsbA [Ramlibacter sp.]|uniref:lipid A export permease/ATP-binding protein MsbA n=1 Tax=Ramlibacter sp. TaxID=1917967 RepID=UPI0039C9E05A